MFQILADGGRGVEWFSTAGGRLTTHRPDRARDFSVRLR
jgi:hypothetical protein